MESNIQQFPHSIADINLSVGEKSIVVVPDIMIGNELFRRTKILIIDADPITVQFLERILIRVRIENFVSTTESSTALTLFQDFKPDLVLIDWLMADENGREIIGQLRAMVPNESFIPIVVLTTDVTSHARQLALASGAEEFIAKPIDAFEVVLRIANMANMRMAHLRLPEQGRALGETHRKHTSDLERTQADLKACRHQLIRAQRLTAVGSMASGIAHDFNNALMLIMGSGEILLNDVERENLTKDNAIPLLQDILAASRNASALVRRLRQFSGARETEEKHRPLNLNLVVEKAVSFTKPRWDSHAIAGGSGIRLDIDCHELPVIIGDAVQLHDAIANLIFYALDAMPNGGALTLRTGVADHCAQLEVSDTGLGMAEDARRICLEPFHTANENYGPELSLAMVLCTFQHHAGTIEIASAPGKGTTFTISFPHM